MALTIRLSTKGLALNETERTRIERQLRALERHELANRPAPQAALVLRRYAAQRRVAVNLRVQLGPLGRHVVSHQAAATPDQAVRLAVADVERQLERLRAAQAGEPTYGVPSRRLPRRRRPHPPSPAAQSPIAPPVSLGGA
jgi:ribosome-associated translation inhibitor RaiA